MDSTKGERVKKNVVSLHCWESFPSVCTLSSLLFLLLRPPLTPPKPLAFTIQPPISIGPSCSSMTQKEVCQSTMWTSTICVCVSKECRRVCACVCVCVRAACVLPCTVILNDVTFSLPLFLSSLLFPTWIHLSFLYGLCLFSPCASFSSVWCWSKAAEHPGIPLKSLFDCFTVTVSVCFSVLFLRLSVCWISKLDVQPATLKADTFFLADTESQGLLLSHSPWRTGA